MDEFLKINIIFMFIKYGLHEIFEKNNIPF